ncbi:hypothetical protein D3C86_1918570 [compost metagenome]
MLGDDRGKRAVKVKVVPLEHGAQGRGKNDLALLLGKPVVGGAARRCIVDCGHKSSPSLLLFTGRSTPLPSCRTLALGLIFIGLRIAQSMHTG